jgi:pyruvate, water dikinase
VTPLERVTDEARFGGKAVQLASALRLGLPVPDGIAFDVEAAARVVSSGRAGRDACAQVFEALAARRLAARSSAVGEDSAQASFAGVHLTRLNVVTPEDLLEALPAIVASGSSASARAYRARLGIDGPCRVAVVVQPMIEPDCAGVMFTQNPVDRSDERVIEASFGLGEAVVSGLVEPDRYRMRRGGEVVDASIGDKDFLIRARAEGGTEEVPVEVGRRRMPCLDANQLAALEDLAARCEASFSGAHDIEWAFAKGTLVLLQRRGVTR